MIYSPPVSWVLYSAHHGSVCHLSWVFYRQCLVSGLPRIDEQSYIRRIRPYNLQWYGIHITWNLAGYVVFLLTHLSSEAMVIFLLRLPNPGDCFPAGRYVEGLTSPHFSGKVKMSDRPADRNMSEW